MLTELIARKLHYKRLCILEIILRLSYIYDFYTEALPTFAWGPEFEKNAYSLIIDYHDGGEPDVAILERIKSEFGDDDKDTDEDECTLTGYLGDAHDTPVTVSGCPGNDTFQVNRNY